MGLIRLLDAERRVSARDVVLSVTSVPRLSAAETDLLQSAIAGGLGVLRTLQTHTETESFGLRAKFLYRRWVLEVLILLRARGPSGFNEVSRALGQLRGESLAPKLAGLVDRGLARRIEPAPRRVRYELTEAGQLLAGGVLALTAGKAEHARALREPGHALPPALPLSDPPPRDDAAALATYSRAVEDFAAARLARAPADLDACVTAARRFSEACVRKWQGEVLATLARGPARFAGLRRATGAGDQALASALVALETLRSVERADGAWRITEAGIFDLALGAPLVLLVPDSTLPDLLHAA